ncbi:hypothetical protein Cni_G21312 [Canna indica]|uniref:Uncharacterized protein n=1 Tax=Canna indica TaxID=4628 RepID=A0AAQ3KQL7_9LILI|nr:hypothetical protein Cni_G21312 [Canna indica]
MEQIRSRSGTAEKQPSSCDDDEAVPAEEDGTTVGEKPVRRLEMAAKKIPAEENGAAVSTGRAEERRDRSPIGVWDTGIDVGSSG